MMLVRADRVREEARALADRGNFGGAATLLRGLLAEIERVPGFVVGDGSPLGEAYELLVDEAMAMERKPDEEAYKMFRKSAMGSKLAMHAPPAASSRGVASSKLMEHAAGNFPEAYVVVKNGAEAGKRHRLARGVRHRPHGERGRRDRERHGLAPACRDLRAGGRVLGVRPGLDERDEGERRAARAARRAS